MVSVPVSSSPDMKSKHTREPRQPEGPGDLIWLSHSMHEGTEPSGGEDLPQTTV